MSITGERDDLGGGPQKVGVAVADLFTGMYSAVGILAALRHALSPETVLGQHVSLLLQIAVDGRRGRTALDHPRQRTLLSRLRRLLNDPLFLRTPRGLVPTARAAELAQPIADILARAAAVMATARPFVATALPAVEGALAAAGTGILVARGSEDEIARARLVLRGNPGAGEPPAATIRHDREARAQFVPVHRRHGRHRRAPGG